MVEPPGEHEPVPETLLPAVVSEARRFQRRRRGAIVAIVAAAAAIVVIGVTGVVVAVLDDGDAPPAAAPTATESVAEPVRMESLGPGWVTGWVSLTERKWGTRIDLTCTYSADNTYGAWPAYAMFVRSADGTVEQVGTWKAEPGRELHVTMAAVGGAGGHRERRGQRPPTGSTGAPAWRRCSPT